MTFRWDISALDQLPDYMKYFYQILLDFYAETEEELSKEGLPLYRMQYAKDAVSSYDLCYNITVIVNTLKIMFQWMPITKLIAAIYSSFYR